LAPCANPSQANRRISTIAYYQQRPQVPSARINQRITAASVRLIDSDGTQIGIGPINEALAIARTRGLDLIEIAPQATPPVCKILDYSKYKYEQDKKEKEARKKQKSGLLKEIRLRPSIGVHDLDVKLRHVSEFLKEHDKVRITVVFRGRENQHKDIGLQLLQQIQQKLLDLASIEGRPSSEGNRMSIMLIPKK
jgi:translation initiation factor IF-3